MKNETSIKYSHCCAQLIMELKVRTKRMPSGNWSCFTTYKGVDKSFEGGIEVVSQMADWLKDEPVKILWIEPVIHEPSKPKTNYRFKRPRIDSGMV